MSECKEYTVEQLIELDMLEAPIDGNHGSIHPKSTDFVSSGVPFIMVNNMSDGNLDLKNCAFISEEQAATLRKGFAKPGDVLLSHKATIGRTAIVPNDYDTIILTPQITYYRIKRDIDNRFLKYYFDSPEFQNLFSNWACSGSTRAYLGITAQRKLPIKLPEIDIQVKIANLLSSIDEKINNNNKINNNLEEQANALFRKLISNNKEYKTVTLGNVTKNIRDRVGEDNVTVLSAVNTGKLQPSNTFFAKRVYSKDTSKYITVKEGSFAYNPARINIGSIGINDLGITGCVSPVYVVFDVDNDYRSFFEFYFKTAKFKAETMLRASGSVRQSLNYNDFALIDIKYPDRGTAQFFNKFWIKQKSIISHLNRENEQLTELRDTLLPKLMSGEIDVSNITI